VQGSGCGISHLDIIIIIIVIIIGIITRALRLT